MKEARKRMMTEKICILIADDHPFIREGLIALINREDDMQVCWQARNGEEALLLFRQHQPDITIMDMHMPVMNGVSATKYICQEFPGASVLGLTSFAEAEERQRIMQAGARACLLKTVALADILSAIRSMATGDGAGSRETSPCLEVSSVSAAGRHSVARLREQGSRLRAEASRIRAALQRQCEHASEMRRLRTQGNDTV